MTACHDVTDSPVALAGIRRVALVGSPNAGKTSVFNHLTGLRAKTGNYPGVTVGRSVGTTTVDGVAIAVEDLPGTYSLDPISPDEQVVTDLLAGKYPDIGRPDAVVLVADVTTLRRSILLIGQVLRLDLPCLLALTMGDELTSRGGRIDVEALSTALGIPVAAVVANHGSGIDDLRAQLASFEQWQRPPVLPPPGQDAIDAWGQSVLDAADYVAPQPDQRTRRIDRVLLHPLWGTVTFFAVMFWFFQVLFTAAAPLRDGIGQRADLAGRSGRRPRRQSDPPRTAQPGNHRRRRHRAAVHPADRVAVLPARVSGERRLHVAGGVLDGPGDGQDRVGGARVRRDALVVRLRDPGNHGDPDAAVVERPDRHHRHRAVDDVLGAAAGVHVAGRPAGSAAKYGGGD